MAANPTAKTGSNSDSKPLQEADHRSLRHDAGLGQMAGHEANVLAWEQTDAGKAFLADEGKRQKAIKAEAKALAAPTQDDGLDEGADKYVEVVSK